MHSKLRTIEIDDSGTGDLVGDAFASTDERTRTFAFIDAITNIMAMLVQLLIVKRAVWRFGVGVTLSLMPIASFIGFILVAINPTFIIVAAFQAIRRAIGFGLSKPTNDMLYSVVTPEERYKSKNFIDTVVYRGGDALAGWLYTGLKSVGLGTGGIAMLAIPIALGWAILGLWLGRTRGEKDDEQATS